MEEVQADEQLVLVLADLAHHVQVEDLVVQGVRHRCPFRSWSVGGSAGAAQEDPAVTPPSTITVWPVT